MLLIAYRSGLFQTFMTSSGLGKAGKHTVYASYFQRQVAPSLA
jgi:hypothetical protein